MDLETLDTINRKLGLAVLLTRHDATIVAEEAERYNGWANRETWALALHLGNDQGLYEEARAYAGQDTDGSALKEWIETLADEVFDGPMADFGPAQMSREVKMMVQEVGSLWRVDWRAVRDSFADDEGS